MSPFIYTACPFSTIFISDYLIYKRFNTICFGFFCAMQVLKQDTNRNNNIYQLGIHALIEVIITNEIKMRGFFVSTLHFQEMDLFILATKNTIIFTKSL